MQKLINNSTGVNNRRRANKGQATAGSQSGFATKAQKRADLVKAFGGD